MSLSSSRWNQQSSSGGSSTSIPPFLAYAWCTNEPIYGQKGAYLKSLNCFNQTRGERSFVVCSFTNLEPAEILDPALCLVLYLGYVRTVLLSTNLGGDGNAQPPAVNCGWHHAGTTTNRLIHCRRCNHRHGRRNLINRKPLDF